MANGRKVGSSVPGGKVMWGRRRGKGEPGGGGTRGLALELVDLSWLT